MCFVALLVFFFLLIMFYIGFQSPFLGFGSVFKSLGMRVNGFRMTWKVMGLSKLIFLTLSPCLVPSTIINPFNLPWGFYGLIVV